MFANCQTAGSDQASPDLCKTPSAGMAPVAYTNTACGKMATPVAWNVHFAGSPAHNLATVTQITTGDSEGSGGGVKSQTFMGKSQHTSGATTVLICGTSLTRMTSTSCQNNGNAQGCRVSPSQTKIQVLAA